MGDVTARNSRIARTAEQGQRTQHKAAQAQQSTVGKAISTANTAMGVYGTVMGFTGGLSEKALMPVFKALSFMQGIACLPASSQLDPVMGIDVHLVMIPPSPSPVPMPHPYIATVFDPKDYVSCAVMTAAAMAAPTPTGNADADAAASLAFTVGTMALGMAGLGATVKLGGFTPRTVSGVSNKTIPHFPMGASFAPCPIKKNTGQAQFGSLFLNADSSPFTGMMHMNNDCWDVGMPQLLRKLYKPKPGELFMPTGFVMAIPSHNVIINPVPTPVSPIALLTKYLNAGFAKILHKIAGKLPKGLRNAASKLICHVTGHPVDVVSGMLFTDEEDFSLPGVIPLSWERTWYSDSNYKGPLGHGWYHSYDAAIAIDETNNQAIYRMNDGRGVVFELPQPGKFTYNRPEKLFLHLHPEEKFYYITDGDGLIYRFTEKIYKDQYTRTGSRLLKSISNMNGYAIRFEYDQDGCLVKIIDGAGRILTVENDEEGRIVNMIAPHPSEVNNTFIIAHYDYDEAGDMICHTDALEQQMKYEYKNHLLAKETWRNGHQWYFEYDGSTTGAKCIHTWGDGDLYNHKLTYTGGCTVVENSLGHFNTYYHKNGLPYIKVDGNGAEWKYRYNAYNELEWETDPLGNQHNYSHDEWGNIITVTDPCGGFTSTEFYHPKFPLLPTEAMDAAGGKWKWEYDEYGNVVEQKDCLNTKTKYRYKNGILTERIDPNGAITYINHDREQNVIEIRNDAGSATQYSHDFLGNCKIITNACDTKQKRFYDLKGRVERIIDFDGNVIDLQYDGIDNLMEFHDNHTSITFTYRGLWEVTSITEAGATIAFHYNTEEQLVKIINEKGLTCKFELDAEGNLTKETGFDNLTQEYKYNLGGWLSQILRPGNKFTNYVYDSCERVTEISYSDSKKEKFSYRPDGELIEAVNESAHVKFERDFLGNILRECVNDEWVSTEYDLSGNVIGVTSSLGANITQHFNKVGDVINMQANGWQAGIETDKLGFEVKRVLPGGIHNQWQRDGIGRPVNQIISKISGPAIKTNRNRRYEWTSTQSLKQIRDEKGSTRFIHDEWANLSKTIFQNGEEQLRNPDAVGNLFRTIERKDRLYSKGNQLLKANGWNYLYDAEGNLLEKQHQNGGSWKFEWNDAGFLKKVKRPDNYEVTFEYDAFGRRISKQFKGTKTRFIWDGDNPLHEWKEYGETAEKSNNPTINNDAITTWIFDNDTSSISAKIKGERKLSVVADHLGTPYQMYDEEGDLVWELELDSYGKIRMEMGESGSCPFRFQGQYEDLETGLYYNRFRYYAVEEGIYLSQDPIRYESGELNFYRYVQDITNWIDPFGLAKTYSANSKKSRKKNHVYKIYNKKTKKVFKFGISSGKKTKKGDSVRANSQKSGIATTEKIPVSRVGTKIIKDKIDRRSTALNVEQQKVNDFNAKNGQPPKYNLRPKPTN